MSVRGKLSVAEPQWVMKQKISFYSVFPSSVQLAGLACGPRCTLPLTMLYLKVMAGTRLPLRQGVVPLAAVPCHNKTNLRGSVPASTLGCFYLFRLNIYPCLVLPKAAALSRSLAHDLRRLFSSTKWREVRATAIRHPPPACRPPLAAASPVSPGTAVGAPGAVQGVHGATTAPARCGSECIPNRQ